MHKFGFTLIELLVTLVVIFTLLLLTLPYGQQHLARHRLKQANQQLMQTLQTAENAARTHNTSITVCNSDSRCDYDWSTGLPSGTTITWRSAHAVLRFSKKTPLKATPGFLAIEFRQIQSQIIVSANGHLRIHSP